MCSLLTVESVIWPEAAAAAALLQHGVCVAVHVYGDSPFCNVSYRVCYTAKSELRKSYGWSGAWKSGGLRAVGPGNRPVSYRRPSQRWEISAPEDDDSQRFTARPGRVARPTCSTPPTALDVWLVPPAPPLLQPWTCGSSHLLHPSYSPGRVARLTCSTPPIQPWTCGSSHLLHPSYSPGRVARLTCSTPPTALDVWLVSPAPPLLQPWTCGSSHLLHPFLSTSHGYTVRLVSSYPATRDSAIVYGQQRRVHSVNGRQTRGQSGPEPLT
ncbi:unnamed protein product [Merluccius merluccius]